MPPRNVSFEFFPPKSDEGADRLRRAVRGLSSFAPVLHSITCAAGGQADGDPFSDTVRWSGRLHAETRVPSVVHLPLCLFNRHTLEEALDRLRLARLDRVVLLRGDGGNDHNPGLAGFASVADAVRHLRANRFKVAVAAYPETHPMARDEDADVDVLLAKFDAGAERAITQFFFDTSDFLRLRDRVARWSPQARLVAGVMPIRDFQRTARFASECGAVIPARVRRLFETADGAEALAAAGETFARQQGAELAAEGVADVHIYTLNHDTPSKALAEAFLELADAREAA